MKELLDEVEVLWCQAMHGQVMWPIHGEYRCRACLRTYPVPFASTAVHAGARSNFAAPRPAETRA